MGTSNTAQRVRAAREARGWSQAELAERACVSRPAISAIETDRLSPSVTAALAIANALQTTVEALFSDAASTHSQALWAWEPQRWPTHYWSAELHGRSLLYPVEGSPAAPLPHGVATNDVEPPPAHALATSTLVVAGCDPAFMWLARLYEAQHSLQMLCLTRASGDALALLSQGLVHAAGIHLGHALPRAGNAGIVRQQGFTFATHLLRACSWETGVAVASALSQATIGELAKSKRIWIGRQTGSGARLWQDKLLPKSRTPTQVAEDHRGVATAIAQGWAEVGICTRLSAEEQQLSFLSLAREQYDLCIPAPLAHDPRLIALQQTVRSPEFRQLVSQLPGYSASDTGDVQYVPAKR